MGIAKNGMSLLEHSIRLMEYLVRIVAIIYIAEMETELIKTGQDGTLLLPVAFIIGVIAGVKITDLKDCLIKK